MAKKDLNWRRTTVVNANALGRVEYIERGKSFSSEQKQIIDPDSGLAGNIPLQWYSGE